MECAHIEYSWWHQKHRKCKNTKEHKNVSHMAHEYTHEYTHESTHEHIWYHLDTYTHISKPMYSHTNSDTANISTT